MFNGTASPSLIFGARTIFHPGSVEYKKKGYKRNRKGEIVRQWKGGPPEWEYEEIKQEAWLDFLPDRRGWGGSIKQEEGDDWRKLHQRAEFIHFRTWFENTAMPALFKWVQGQEPSSSQVFELVHQEMAVRYVLRASPNASYGYVYIAAWRE